MSTDSTPCTFLASVVSMCSTLAKPCGERTNCANSAPCGLTSSPKRPLPRSSGSSSMRPCHCCATVELVIRALQNISKAGFDAGCGIEGVDVRLHLRLGGVGRGRVRPAGLGAGIKRDLLVLLRGAAGNPVGPDHLVALEHRRRAAAGGDAAMGHGGEADQQLRIALLEPLLDDEAVGKARAHGAECSDGIGLGDGGVGG